MNPFTNGRVRKAPENFLSPEDAKRVVAEAREGRRDFIRAAFASAAAVPAWVAAATDDPDIMKLPEHSKGLGQGVAVQPYGQPSKYESGVRRRESPGLSQTTQASVAFTPLQSLFGIVTPSGLHFERHHQGWWDIDPSHHRLMVHGEDDSLVREPMVFTMDDLMRLPSVSRFHFIECGANTSMEWANVAVPTCQYTHGMLACSEFTGVPLRSVLECVGADFKRGRFVLAEGADGAAQSRTIPMELIESGEVLLAYGQNGEMLRPQQGYPLRLVVPGVQGVSWIKYLRRIKVGDQPFGAKDETIGYTDLMPDGQQRQYTSIMEVKSVVTTPSGGQVLLDKGCQTITGLAWSGRGRIARVDVSVDGGRNWREARLQTPVMSKCLTRFNLDWVWDGSPALVMSRATDETGQIQPNYRELRAVRGTRSIYHNNAIQTWLVQESGEVRNVQLS